MTRKDYILIAAAFATSRPEPRGTVESWCRGWENAVNMVATALAQDNPRFDRERFLKACGVAS